MKLAVCFLTSAMAALLQGGGPDVSHGEPPLKTEYRPVSFECKSYPEIAVESYGGVSGTPAAEAAGLRRAAVQCLMILLEPYLRPGVLQEDSKLVEQIIMREYVQLRGTEQSSSPADRGADVIYLPFVHEHRQWMVVQVGQTPEALAICFALSSQEALVLRSPRQAEDLIQTTLSSLVGVEDEMPYDLVATALERGEHPVLRLRPRATKTDEGNGPIDGKDEYWNVRSFRARVGGIASENGVIMIVPYPRSEFAMGRHTPPWELFENLKNGVRNPGRP